MRGDLLVDEEETVGSQQLAGGRRQEAVRRLQVRRLEGWGGNFRNFVNLMNF